MKEFNIKHVRRTQPKYHTYTTKNKNAILKNKKQKISHPVIDNFLEFLEVNIEHSNRDVAQFNITDDKIQMPFKSYFKKLSGVDREQNYYSTLFHELAHWTGDYKRMNRKTLVEYDPEYKREGYDASPCVIEEITAELTANMLMEFFKLQSSPSYQSLALINKELSFVDNAHQVNVYNKASNQAIRTYNYLIKQFESYVKKNQNR
jgi:antirestriction protein ArdC